MHRPAPSTMGHHSQIAIDSPITTLTNLPYEVREEIYRLVLGEPGEVFIGNSKHLTSGTRDYLSLAFTSKELYSECARYFYSHTVFGLEDAASNVVKFLRNTPSHFLQCIRVVHYSHKDKLPLTDKLAKDVKMLMQRHDRQPLRTATANFRTIFPLMADKLTGLEALFVRLPIFSGSYHMVHRYGRQTFACHCDPMPFLDTLSSIRPLNIPYVSVKLFTICTRTIFYDGWGLQNMAFVDCGAHGRAEWIEEMMRGEKRMTWRTMRPLLDLKSREDEELILWPEPEPEPEVDLGAAAAAAAAAGSG